jgi:hypothetical protein
MKMRLFLIIASLVISIAQSAVAKADLLHFEIVGPDINFSFDLDRQPAFTPSPTFGGSGSFVVANVPNSLQGKFPFLAFYNCTADDCNGGAFAASTLNNDSGDIVSFFGDQLFTIVSGQPTFLTSTPDHPFQIFHVVPGADNFPEAQLFITEAAAVPGPIVGAGLPGLVLGVGALLAWRRRRNPNAVA